ncbi:MAG: helix-turn-helix transcriptional regulator [Lachnospiraceae bacterium]|nr:helix-turn-helix transcriptional regulator [Lachnospiraceae bacterium]
MKKRSAKSCQTAVNRTSYNKYLYEVRMKRGLSCRQFARALRIPPLFYRLIESGYIMPGPRLKERISACCGEDYKPYCEGISSYPEELPQKKPLKITVWFFNVMGSVPFRILLCLLIVSALGCLSYGFKEYDRYDRNAMADAPDALQKLMRGIRDEGSLTLSPSGTIARMEIFRTDGNEKMVSVKADTDDSFPYNVDFTVHRWSDVGRLSYHVCLNKEDPDTVSAGYSDYTTGQSYDARIDLSGETPVLISLYSKVYSVEDAELSDQLKETLLSEVSSFRPEVEALIRDKLGLEIDLAQLHRDSAAAYDAYSSGWILSIVFLVLGGCLTLLLLFFLIYCLIYGTKNGVRRQVLTGSNLISYAMLSEPKTDIKLFPFLPETLLSLIGSTILMRSSFRVISYAAVFIGVGDLDLSSAAVINTQFMNYYYLGMFLLYFLDFDLFLDDMRVMGRIFLYLFLYLGLYALEYSVMSYLVNSGSPLYQLAGSFTPPNMFGTICLYFVMMLFLFFTPRFITTKKRLILYRLCSLIPALVIFGAHVVSKGAKVLFGWELPLSLRLLLNGEKIPFSVLCVSYLFMLFFLRLFFERRYGTENARKIFNGNRFLWIKNGLTCLLILFIVVLNLLMGRGSQAVDFGWGQATDLLLLVPLIFFYHPHKGPRSRFVDALTMTYYLFALSIGYVLAIIIVLLGGL